MKASSTNVLCGGKTGWTFIGVSMVDINFVVLCCMVQNLFLGRREGDSKILLFESSGADRPLRKCIPHCPKIKWRKVNNADSGVIFRFPQSSSKVAPKIQPYSRSFLGITFLLYIFLNRFAFFKWKTKWKKLRNRIACFFLNYVWECKECSFN